MIFKILAIPLKCLVRIYQAVFSPWMPHVCRHEPSCSQYALDALDQHGPFKGALLTVKRILKCHPWGTSGYDPVPSNDQRLKISDQL